MCVNYLLKSKNFLRVKCLVETLKAVSLSVRLCNENSTVLFTSR